MKDLYRIKEVTREIHGEKKTFFYPQEKSIEIITTGHLWWKKYTRKDVWINMYKDKKTGTIYSENFSDCYLLVADSFSEAEALIDIELKARITRTNKNYRENSVFIADNNEAVKIHPLK